MNVQQQKREKSKYRWPEITGGMVIGFFVGLAMSAMIVFVLGEIRLGMVQKKLAGDFELVKVVFTTEPVAPGEPVSPDNLAQRPFPKFVVTPNTVLPHEVDALFGKGPTIRFEKGDVLLRSAFGLEPRPDAPPEPEKD